MRLAVVVVALALAVAAPVAGQAIVETLTAEGDMTVSTPDARLVVDLNTTSFDLSAPSATLTLVDDWGDVYSLPPGNNPVVLDFNRNVQTVELVGVRLDSERPDPDGLLLVSEAGEGYAAESRVNGRLTVESARDEVIESHHYFQEKERGEDLADPTGKWGQYYYEYRSGDGLALGVDGAADHTVRGDFTLYLWGTTLHATTDDGIRTYRTGAFDTPSDADAGAGVLVQEHNVFALLEVRDGVLTTTGQGGSYYGESVTLSLDGVAMLTDAGGAIATSDGRHVLSGGAVVEGGAYDLSRGGSDVQVAIRQAPTSIRGGTLTAPASPLLGPWLGVAAVLLIAVGTVQARPAAVAGLAQARYRRVSSNEVPRLSLRELRADGHHRLGCRAEVRGAYRRALRHVDRSLHLEPDNPEVFAMRGSILRRLGRHQDAVESHKRAHEWLDVCDGDRDDLAHNAFEAARACALGGRTVDALHWLDIAVRADPDLCEELALEPDFAAVAETREFQALARGGGRSCGRRRPSSSFPRTRSDHCDL